MTIKVCRLLDGDLDAALLEEALAEAAADPDLRDRATLYTLVGDALRGNSTPDDGFSKRIFARMQAERVEIDPDFDPLA